MQRNHLKVGFRDHIAGFRSTAVLAVAVLAATSSAADQSLEQSTDSLLIHFEEDGRAGYLNVQTGNWVIRPAFREAHGFSQGLAAVQISGDWGYIDEKGAVAIQPTFLWAGPFHDGIACVGSGPQKATYITTTGKPIASTEVDEGLIWRANRAPQFFNGRALISVNGKMGYIDATGRTVIEPTYSEAKPFSEGVAPVFAGTSWRLIDVTGHTRGATDTITWGFSDARTGTFSEGLGVAMSVKAPGFLGYVSTNGSAALEFKFMEADRFAEGLAAVRQVEYVGTNGHRAGLVGFINREGKYVIEPRFENGRSFSEGLAAVATNRKWGYIDPTGRMVIAPQFADAGAFRRGRALVSVGDEPKTQDPFASSLMQRKLACIDRRGTIVWGPKAPQDRRTQSERLLDAWVVQSVRRLRQGDQAAKNRAEQDLMKLPSAAVSVLREYAASADKDLQTRVQRLITFLSSDTKARQERLLSVLQGWGVSEYGLQETNGGYEIILNSRPVDDISPLRGFPVKSLQMVSTPVRDLSPLIGMPLERLAVDGSCDLAPIRTLPLKELNLSSGTNDLRALKGLALEKLVLDRCWGIDLTVLKGMPLKDLTLQELPISDLSPLAGLPLTNLALVSCWRVKDLAFVADMPLQTISFDQLDITNGLAELRRLPALISINRKPPQEFWRREDLLESLKTRMQAAGLTYTRLQMDSGGLCTLKLAPGSATDLSPLAGAPIKSLSLTGTAVTDLTPLKGMKLESITLPTQRITNGIEALRVMATLKSINDLRPQRFWVAYDAVTKQERWRRLLGARNVKFSDFHVTENGTVILELDRSTPDLSGLIGMPINELSIPLTPITDLSPLKGMPLTRLWADDTPLSNLAPLEGMQIMSLNLGHTRVADLSALRGMPLHLLYLMKTEVQDLSPLTGMPLYELNIDDTRVRDLTPLKGMKLGKLAACNTLVADLSPLAGMRLFGLYINGTKISDLSPVEDMQIVELGFTPENISRGLDALRRKQGLSKVVIARPGAHALVMPISEFWTRYDAGEFRPAPR